MEGFGGGYCCNCCRVPPGGVVAGVVGIDRLFMTVSMANELGPAIFPFQKEPSGFTPPIPLDALDGGVGNDIDRSRPGLSWL